MFGLCMIKEYLDEILDGKKSFDARAYPTNKRGTIALVNSKTSKIEGYADLVDCHEISPEEYAKWHCTGCFKGCMFSCDSKKKYYAYDLRNVKKVENQIKVVKTGRVWTTLYSK